MTSSLPSLAAIQAAFANGAYPLYPQSQIMAPSVSPALQDSSTRQEPKRKTSGASTARKSSKTSGDATPHSNTQIQHMSTGPPSYNGDASDLDSNSENEATSQPKKKQNRRPPLDPKRREQNRAAQRAWRERKEKHLKDLEERVKVLEAERDGHESETKNLKNMLETLTRENETLRSFAFTFVAQATGQQMQEGAEDDVSSLPMTLIGDSSQPYQLHFSPESTSPPMPPPLHRYPSEPSDQGYVSKESPSSTHSGSAGGSLDQYSSSIGGQSWRTADDHMGSTSSFPVTHTSRPIAPVHSRAPSYASIHDAALFPQGSSDPTHRARTDSQSSAALSSVSSFLPSVSVTSPSTVSGDPSASGHPASYNASKLDATFLPLSVSDPTTPSLRDLMKLEVMDDGPAGSGRPPVVAAPPTTVLGKGFLQFRDAGRESEWGGVDDDDDMGLPVSIMNRKLSSMKSVANANGTAPAQANPADRTALVPEEPDFADLDDLLDPSAFDNPSDWPMPTDFSDWSAYPPSVLDIIGEVLPQVSVDGGDLAQWAGLPIPEGELNLMDDSMACPLDKVSQALAGDMNLPIPPLKPPTGKVDVSSLPPPVVYDLLRKLDPEAVHLSPENVNALRTLDPRRIPCPMTAKRMAELKRVFARGVEARGSCGRMVLVGKGSASGGLSPEDFEDLCLMMRNTSCEEAGKRVLAAAQKLVEARNALNQIEPPKDAWAKVLVARKELKEIIDRTPDVDRAIMTEFMKKYDTWGDVLDMEYDPQSVNTILQFVGCKEGGKEGGKS